MYRLYKCILKNKVLQIRVIGVGNNRVNPSVCKKPFVRKQTSDFIQTLWGFPGFSKHHANIF